MTDEEYEKTIPVEIKERVLRITDQEAEKRFRELAARV